jgi:hypothetical protein
VHLLAPQHKHRCIPRAAPVFARVAEHVVHADNAFQHQIGTWPAPLRIIAVWQDPV